jgi:hypothetical protein
MRPNTRTVEVQSSDQSDLFLLFMNVVDCKQTRDLVKGYVGQSAQPVEMDSMYDLYGRYDSVIKFRCPTAETGRKFKEELTRQLGRAGRGGQIREGRLPRYFDVWKEAYSLDEFLGRSAPASRRLEVPLATGDYEVTGRMKAFIVIERCEGSSAEEIVGELRDVVRSHDSARSVKGIEDIIQAVYSDGQSNVILEVEMRCSQVHLLNRLSECIERVIDPKGADKLTHIAYAHEVLVGTPP